MMRAAALLIALFAASGARAQALDAECAASFPARLQDAKQALAQWGDEHEHYVDARPLLEYFDPHCRFLSERERATRKLHDANAFVCDAPKPKALTAEIVLRYSVEPSLGVYQARAGDNARCLEHDRAARVELVISVAGDKSSVAQQLLVMCYDDDRPRCVSARAMIEAGRAKNPTP